MDQLPPPIPVPVLTPVPTQLELQSSSPTVQQSNTPAKASVRRPRIELNKRCKDPPEDMFADHQREPAAEVSAMSASTPALTSVQSSPAATVEEDSNIEVQEIKQLSSKRKRRAIYSSSNEEETGEKSELVITPTRNQFNNVSDNSPVSKCPKTGAYVSPGVTIAPEMSPPSPRPGSDDSGEEMIVVQEDDVPVAPPPVAPPMCFCHQTGHRCHLCNIKVCNFCSIDYLGDEDKRVHQDCFQRHNPFPVFHPSDADIANHDNLIQRALGLNSDSWADTKIPRRNLFATSPSSPSTPISSTSSPSTATSTSSERQVSVIMKTPERQVRQVRQDVIASPLRTPVSNFLDQQCSSPSTAKQASPKSRFISRFTDQHNVEQEKQESVEMYAGKIPTVKFIGKAGQKMWALDNFEFYIIIPDVSITMICLDLTVRPITMDQLRDILLLSLENTSFVQPTLFYQGEKVDGEKLLKTYPAKTALILAAASLELQHSGKLFSCECPDCANENGLMIGWTVIANYANHAKNSSCNCAHPLFMERFLDGKKSWGKNQNFAAKKKSKPFGCPPGHSGPEDPTESSQQSVSQRDTPASSTSQSVIQVDRPASSTSQSVNRQVESAAQSSSQAERPVRNRPAYRRQQDIEQDLLDSMSEGEDADEPTGSDRTQKEKTVCPLTIMDRDDRVKENRDRRRDRMTRNLAMEYDDNMQFIPNDADIEFERKFIIASALTTSNKKSYDAERKMSEKSKEAFKEGRVQDVDKNDEKFMPNTWVLYRTGARAIMTSLTKYYEREIHYDDYLAFGEERFIRCKNVLTELEDLPSGNLGAHAYEGFKLIIQAQLEESRKDKNEAKFKAEIQGWETFDPLVLKAKCHKRAEAMRREAHDLLSEMKSTKPHGQFDRKQKIQTETRARDKEQQEGFKLLDPAEVIPKYLMNEDVKSVEKHLIDCATKKILPSDSDFKEFTNTLLVRLIIKNGKRKQIFVGMTRREFVTAKQKGIKVYDLTPADDRELMRGNQNVYNFGDMGAVRIEESPVDTGDRPSVLEGILLQREVHKTSDKGPATVFLSLPDVMLLDCYHIVAGLYAKSKNLHYNVDSTLFINLHGNRVADINFTLFCDITGYSDYHTHLSRKVYATWMNNQHNMMLREFAAFAANHSVAVQQSTYLGSSSRRLAVICADQFFHRNVAAETVSTGGQRVSINPDYDLETAENMAQINKDDWARYVRQRRQEDLQILPKPDRFVTPDVAINVLSLITAVGSEGSLGRRLDGLDILEFYLSGNIPFFN